MRRIVFFGNCQAGILERIYREYLAVRYGDHTHWLKSWLDPTSEDITALRDCDLLLEQVSNLEFYCDISAYRHDPRTVQFPTVCLGFLWPFGNEGHPNNYPLSYRPQGPFEMNEGDRVLNTRIKAGVDPHEALASYLNEKQLLSPSRIDRYYEMYMDQQREMDAKTGFNFADLMESSFRSEQIFLTPYHPNLSFTKFFVSEILQRFVAARSDATNAVNGLMRSPFPFTELPVHPLIARQLRVEWAYPAKTYVTMTGEKYTHFEYFERYLNFEWNGRLAELMHLASERGNESESMVMELRECMRTSRPSAEAQMVLASLLSRLRRFEEAMAAYQSAMDIDEPRADSLRGLAVCQLELGNSADALCNLERSLAIAPSNPDTLRDFSRALALEGRTEEAINSAKLAVLYAPAAPEQIEHLCDLLLDAGDASTASTLMSKLICQWPTAPILTVHVRFLERQGHFLEAISAADNALRRHRYDRDLTRFAAGCMLRVNEHARAEALLRDALSHAEDAELLNVLGSALSAQDKVDDAISAVKRAIVLAPKHPYYVAHLASLLERVQEIDGAEQNYRLAAQLNPHDSGFATALARLRAMNNVSVREGN